MSDQTLFHLVMGIEIARCQFSGGMGSAASRASGLPATTYNAAGLNPATVARYGGTPVASAINAIHVDKEVLTSVQESSLKGKMPTAVGTSYTVPGHGNALSRHSMDQVIDGIEAQKKQDEAILTTALTHG